uniref:Carbohydrate kinase FGGY N-terminal domain-containing protein n=1 Tax=Eptatretus burgeri TaxID=7764 RepID=A0A8C4Q0B6_EPTBU
MLGVGTLATCRSESKDHGTILEARPVSDSKGFRHAKDSKTAVAGYVLAIDVGTTTIQGIVYGKQAEIVGSASEKTALLYPRPGWVELEPEALYEQFVRVAQATLRDSGVKASEIVALGIATQRGTFCTWHRETGKPLHNLLGWQDLRASHLVKDWNHSFTFKCLQGSCKLLHAFSRQQRFQAASILRFSTQQVSLRLVWALKNIPQLGAAVREGNCCFGCIDTWLLYKLTNGQVYATDYSNASATGVFDPFQMEWNGLLCSLLSIPPEIFPPIRDTGHIFGYIDKAVLGVSVPVAAVIADQQAAMFGECCFTRGDVKLTMGTGTFVNMNTGEDPYTAVAASEQARHPHHSANRTTTTPPPPSKLPHLRHSPFSRPCAVTISGNKQKPTTMLGGFPACFSRRNSPRSVWGRCDPSRGQKSCKGGV